MREAFAVCGPSARDAVVAALDALGPTVGDFFMTLVAFMMFRRLRGEVFDVPRLAETPAITALFQAEIAARGIAGAMLHYEVVLDAELQVLGRVRFRSRPTGRTSSRSSRSSRRSCRVRVRRGTRSLSPGGCSAASDLDAQLGAADTAIVFAPRRAGAAKCCTVMRGAFVRLR
jgi:hypothetical protein